MKTLLINTLLLFAITGYAQQGKLVGLWEMTRVLVGDEVMTPVAKWTKINTDGTFKSGNGWLQNSYGSWQYDADTKIFTSFDSLGIKDKYEGFTVFFNKDTMVWEREEDGNKVRVTLKPIQQLPMAPADYLTGLWELESTTKEGQQFVPESDKAKQARIFIRWDRIYVSFDKEGKKSTGYWHINGHRPELTLLPHQDGAKPESWRVEVNKDELTMSGISEGNREFTRKYVRRHSF